MDDAYHILKAVPPLLSCDANNIITKREGVQSKDHIDQPYKNGPTDFRSTSMHLFENEVLLSASDLTRFIGCRHATTLDLAYLRGEGPEPREDSEDAELLQKYGFAHEENYLDKLQSQGRKVLGLTGSDLLNTAIATRDAMQMGVDVIYQGALMNNRWGGWADFIEQAPMLAQRLTRG